MVGLLAAGSGLLDPVLEARVGPGSGPDADGRVVEDLVRCVDAACGPALAAIDSDMTLPAAVKAALQAAIARCLLPPQP